MILRFDGKNPQYRNRLEQELQSRVLTIAKKNSDAMAEETGIETSMNEDDMKDYLEKVMNELHSK